MGTGKISGDQIGNLAVGAAQLAANAVTTNKIADNAVTTVKIPAAAIVNAKIRDDAVTTAKILDGQVTNAKIHASAGIVESKLALNRPTALTLGDVSGRVLITGTATISIGDLFVDAVFAGAFEFDSVAFVVSVTRLTPIPTGLSTAASPGIWVSDKAVTGFRINLAETELDADVDFEYIAIGPEA